MRQLANGGHISPKQKTLSSVTLSSVTGMRQSNFSMLPNQPVCLPLLSVSNKFVWVLSHQIYLQPDAVAELNKAFDKFPYLTLKQTNALAQRCSLHPQQVRVWFMAQRVCYGISWDYTDIREARKHFKSIPKDDDEKGSNRPNGEMDERGKKGDQKDVEGGSGEKKKERANRKKTKIKDVKASIPQKPIGETIAKSRKRRVMKEDDAEKTAGEEEETNQNENERLTCTSEEGVLTRGRKKSKKEEMKPLHENPAVSEVPLGTSPLIKPPLLTLRSIPASKTDLLDRAEVPCTASNMTPGNSILEGQMDTLVGLEENLHKDFTNLTISVTDVDKLKKHITTGNSGVTAGDPPAPIKAEDHVADKNSPPAQTCTRARMQDQLKKMHAAFRSCQYPDRVQYGLLSETIGISRNRLVQWYGDMRYAIKRSKPRWMNPTEYKQVLANIKYRQYIKTLPKSLPTSGCGDATWLRLLEDEKEDLKPSPPE